MVEWVVNTSGELGVKIGNTCYYLYKGESLIYETEPMMYRKVEKREFGESCISPEYCKTTKINPENEQLIFDQTKKTREFLVENQYQKYLKKIQIANENHQNYVTIGSDGMFNENIERFKEKGLKISHLESPGLGVFSHLVW